jgi:hypothetical protein
MIFLNIRHGDQAEIELRNEDNLFLPLARKKFDFFRV